MGISETGYRYQPRLSSENAGIADGLIRYHRTVRYEWLNQHRFESIQQARESATQWL